MNIFKKIILALSLFCVSYNVNANIFDDIGEFVEDAIDCAEDPCNCGTSNPEVIEEWGQNDGNPRASSETYNRLCPPYNKEDGRDDHTCLVRDKDQWTGEAIPFPRSHSLYYENICAESTPESTYFDPKIRIRGQQCNAFACWTTNTTLNWDGECVTLASGYGLPLHRMCARVALPESKQIGELGEAGYKEALPADPGYTEGKHLSYEGEELIDEPIELIDGSRLTPKRPKLCAYYDESFLGAGGLDIMDLDPNSQPFHATSGKVHPVVEVIITIVDFGSNLAALLPQLISSGTEALSDEVSSEDSPPNPLDAITAIMDLLEIIFEALGEGVVALLKELGEMNRSVSDQVYGCVELPEGPMPPPYCPTIKAIPVPSIQKVCHVDRSTLDPVESFDDALCVKSEKRNNYIHNTVRVGYDYFVPLCSNNSSTEDFNPEENDSCINIENIVVTPTAIHTLSQGLDIVPKCSGGGGSACVRTMTECDGDCNDNGGFRIVYAKKTGSTVIPSNYYRSDLPDCEAVPNIDIDNNNVEFSCQLVWGINAKPFKDITVEFGEEEQADDESDARSSNVEIDFTSSEDYQFRATINRKAGRNDTTGQYQDTNKICVTSTAVPDDGFLGCVERALEPHLIAYRCSNSPTSASCSSSYFDPKLILAYVTGYNDNNGDYEGHDVSSIKVDTNTFHEPRTEPIYLIGSQFKSFVTDDAITRAPFKDSLVDPLTLVGTYIDRNNLDSSDSDNLIQPFSYDPDNDPAFVANEDAIYIYGLQYLNGKYHVGGKHVCVSKVSQKQCHEDQSVCVLSKVINSDIYSCEKWKEKIQRYPAMRRYVDELDDPLGCEDIEILNGFNGAEIKIKRCGPPGSASEDKNLFRYKLNDVSDVEGEICVTSILPEDRVDPEILDGSGDPVQVLQDFQYFSYNPKNTWERNITRAIFDPVVLDSCIDDDGEYTKCAVRDKTPRELGLCVVVPQGNCSAKNTYQQEDGYASWPETPVGEKATGTCRPGWVEENGPLERYCVPVPNSETFEFNEMPVNSTTNPLDPGFGQPVSRCVDPSV